MDKYLSPLPSRWSLCSLTLLLSSNSIREIASVVILAHFKRFPWIMEPIFRIFIGIGILNTQWLSIPIKEFMCTIEVKEKGIGIILTQLTISQNKFYLLDLGAGMNSESIKNQAYSMFISITQHRRNMRKQNNIIRQKTINTT